MSRGAARRRAALELVIAVAAIVVGVRALRGGERSLPFFAGFVPAALVGAFWIMFAVGEVVIPH